MKNTISPPGIPYTKSQSKKKLRLTESRVSTKLRFSGYLGLFICAASLFTFRAAWGINLPIVGLLIIALGVFRHPKSLKSKSIQLLLTTWLALAVAVVMHLNPWTVIPFVLSTGVVVGAVSLNNKIDPLRSYFLFLIQLLFIPPVFFKRAFTFFKDVTFISSKRSINFAWGLMMSITIVVFAVLYISSNQILSEQFANFLAKPINFYLISDGIGLGFSLLAWSIVFTGLFYAKRNFNPKIRQSLKFGKSKPFLSSSEEKWSRVSVGLFILNAMTLGLNIIDVITVWLSTVATDAATLSHGVHAGTNTLIAAILLAVAYLIYHFNTTPKDYKRARVLATVWLVQNAILICTVFIRNYHYFSNYGLTFKRLGVYLFLACTLTGLYFLRTKLIENQSIDQLLKNQVWAVYLIIVIAALPNWPGVITKYNLGLKQIDYVHLYGLLPYNFDVLLETRPDLYPRVTNRSHINPVEDFRDWDYLQARSLEVKLELENFNTNTK